MSKRLVHKVVLSLILVGMFVLPIMNAYAQADDTNKILVVGEVEAFDAETVTVNGLVISLADAEMEVALEVGMAIQVEAYAVDDALVASKIKESDDLLAGELVYLGVIEDISLDAMTIGGITIDIANANVGETLAVGDWAKVFFSIDGDGLWSVRIVAPLSDEADDSTDDSGDDDTEPVSAIYGTLDLIGDGYVVIGGITVYTTDIDTSNLIVGSIVALEFSVDENGQFAAISITPTTDDDALEFDGVSDDENEDSNDDSIDDSEDDDNGSDDDGDDEHEDEHDDDHDEDNDRDHEDEHDDDHEDSHDNDHEDHEEEDD